MSQVPRSTRTQLCQEALDRLTSCSVDGAPIVRKAAAAALGILLHFDSLCDQDPAMLQRACALAEVSQHDGGQNLSPGV